MAAKKEKYIKKHKDGSIWAKGQILNGKMEGFWQWFRKDGSKMRTGYFKANKQVGKWTTYTSKGKVVKVTNFK
jgi:antitoxin component YwqK of YwqJK toxin-antitoxin module